MSVVIVGAGIAGLVTAWELARAGRAVTVLEAESVVGGTLRAATSAGVDVGAESFAIRTSAVADLVRDAALDVEIVGPVPGGAHLLSVDDHGASSLHPLPARTVLGLPADPAADDVAAIIGAPGVERALREPEIVLPDDDEPSLRDLAADRFGAAVADRLVDPLCRSVYSQPAAALVLSRVHPRLWEAYVRTRSLTAAVGTVADAAPAGAAVRGVRGGMWRLATALADAARRAGAVILTGETVLEVTAERVTTRSRVFEASQVVLATGAGPARRLLHLPPRDADTRVRVVTALVRGRALDARPVGSGVIVAPFAPSRAKAATHVSAKWSWVQQALPEGVHAVRVSARDAATADLAHPDVLAAEISMLLGTPIDPSDLIEIVETVWPDAVVTRDDALTSAAAATRVTLVGALVAGTGLAAVVPHARYVARDLLSAPR